jgi:uncharacterized membrane protein
MILVIPAVVILAGVITGLSVFETLLIFVLGVIWLGFLGWILVERYRANLLRCLLFWWIAKMLDKPELIYPA